MPSCWPLFRSVATAVRHSHPARHLRHLGHHAVVRHAQTAVQAAATAAPPAVCRKFAAGLLAGGLSVMGPAATPAGLGANLGGVGGFPHGFLSEYGGTGTGPANAGGTAGASLAAAMGRDRADGAVPSESAADIGALSPESGLSPVAFTTPMLLGSAAGALPATGAIAGEAKPSDLPVQVDEPSSALILLPTLAGLLLVRRRLVAHVRVSRGEKGRR